MAESGIHLPAEMVAWVESATGGVVTAAWRQAGGGRKQAWFVDVAGSHDAGDHVQALFLRWDPSDPAANGDPWTVRREAEVYRALSNTDVPVARFIAVHPTAEAMLATRVTGRNWFSHITDHDQQLAVAQDFVRHLATLHRIDVRTLAIPGYDPGATVPVLVRRQLEELTALVAFRGGQPEPALQIALDWLAANVPSYEGPAVLVQGDTGPGNFMYEGNRVTAIVDWELAHLGDPMDDVAWVSLRSVQEPFTDLRDRLAEYSAQSGHPLDVARIKYYRVLGEAKILTMNHGTSLRDRAAAEGGGNDAGARLIFGQLHRRLCFEALADVVGISLPPYELPPEPPRTDIDDLFDIVLSQLRNVVTPRITDSFALQRTKGLARVLKYLAESTRRSGELDAQELDEVEALLGARPSSTAAGRRDLAAAWRAGRLDARPVIAALYRGIQRDNELLRGASGALADRHYDPLD